MSVPRCLICGGDHPERRDLCNACAEVMEANKGIIEAMRQRLPVEHEGIKYGCISAFIVRTRASHLEPLKQRYALQVELMSANSHSKTIADPKEVKVLKDYRKEREK